MIYTTKMWILLGYCFKNLVLYLELSKEILVLQ